MPVWCCHNTSNCSFRNSNHSQASSSVSDDDDDDDEDDEGENDDSDDESDDDDLEDTHVSVGQMPYSVNFSANHLGNRNIDWDNVSVPETVRILTTKQGAKVIVVGTAHFSEESVKDVTNVMQQFRPDVVVLELCKNRTHILHLDEKTVLAESQNLSAQKIVRRFHTKIVSLFSTDPISFRGRLFVNMVLCRV